MEDYEKKTEIIKFRATRAQRYEITRRALDYGFSSVSAFVLWATLEEDHTEKGAAALTDALDKINADARDTIEMIREGIQSDRAKYSAAVDEAADRFNEAAARLDQSGEENARRIEDALQRFEDERKAAARAADIERKKGEGNFFMEVLPMIGAAGALVLAVYVFQHFMK